MITIHYELVNKLLDIVRKFDKEQHHPDLLFGGIEDALRSNGWIQKNEKPIFPIKCTECGIEEIITPDGYCNCCGGKQKNYSKWTTPD